MEILFDENSVIKQMMTSLFVCTVSDIVLMYTLYE